MVRFRIDPELCMMCFACQSVCPTGAIQAAEQSLVISPDVCDACGICANFCPVQAIRPGTEDLSVAEAPGIRNPFATASGAVGSIETTGRQRENGTRMSGQSAAPTCSIHTIRLDMSGDDRHQRKGRE